MDHAIHELLRQSAGVVGRRRYPELADQLDYLCRRGVLTAILPGVYAHRDVASDWRTMVRGVCEWDERAVIIREPAAALTYWPELKPTTVEVAGRRAYFRRRGITFTRRTIPPELIVQVAGVRMTSPALTALDLVSSHGGDAIDRALRSRMATLEGMHQALELTPSRTGNADRRLMLLDSRDKPWSEAERLSHRLMRDGGITGWRTNVPIVCDGHLFYQDIAMDDCPLVIEIDGRIHLRADVFEADRFRGNCLLLAGKQVLHFTWLMLTRRPDWFLSTTRRAIDLLS